ncbi:hypothetical protein [Ancylomarina sp. 16SWW S1-10-2]|uniref:hypothetical protein n=1 Tax=Ancylomarina sp. 16SWW S1-10-2 TaxID=2499681 RepID=UPI0012AD616F|nr:hypothetical protein [Ancylomarina sp. 16SWW S1-10-2]MRT93868.1 hypothetical protein [Ancylomarina sp. 16SWW S1-10-2]
MKKKISLTKNELKENVKLLDTVVNRAVQAKIFGGYIPPSYQRTVYAESTYVRGVFVPIVFK